MDTYHRQCFGLLKLGLSKRSVEQTHAVIHSALRQAVKWELIHRNPTEAVKVPRPGRKEMKTLSVGQVKILFETTRNDREHALWVTLITTGLRIGEALGLRWQDCNFETNSMTIQRALQRQVGAGLVIVEPKTAGGRRTVHFPPETGTALNDHRRRQLEERLAAGPAWTDGDLVFCQATGTPMDPSAASRYLRSALDRAGLPRIRVHDCRHTCASYYLSKNVHPSVVQELLGHSSVMLTLSTYSHVTPALHREAVVHMSDLFEAV